MLVICCVNFMNNIVGRVELIIVLVIYIMVCMKIK